MASRSFRIVAACITLTLYLAVMVVGDVAAITCGCNHHHIVAHQPDTHTAFGHIHSHSCCAEHHAVCCSTPLLDEACDCHHSHSTNVELYLASLSDGANGGPQRETILAGFLIEPYNFDIDGLVECTDYGERLFLPGSQYCVKSHSLRAPPQCA